MSVQVEKLITDILAREGHGFTDHPSDRGGPTKYGITLSTLCSWRNATDLTAAEVQCLTEEEARKIYFNEYVIKPGFVLVLSMSEPLGIEVIDSGVNCGQRRAGMWLQTALNAFNRSFRHPPDYPELKVDGFIGQITINAMSKFFALRGKARGERVLLRAMNSQQGTHYLELGAKSPSQEDFMLGWFDNRIS